MEKHPFISKLFDAIPLIVSFDLDIKLKQSALKQCESFVSASAATDIFYLLRRSLKDGSKAKESMENLLQLVGISDALGEDVYAAVASNRTDFEDALVASIAARCHMVLIVARNVKDYTESPVKAMTPEELLKR
ncbi:MAG: PIN domain-containing protein [Eubacteriales bacterium]|nr:PIN domain-containing protein [Eubacteriales bacterium]